MFLEKDIPPQPGRDILFVFAPAQISLYIIPAMCYNNYI